MKYLADVTYTTGVRQLSGPHSPRTSCGLVSHRDAPGMAYSHLQSATLALDGTRLFNLLEECRLRYGRLDRERALTTLLRWRDGYDTLPDEMTQHLFTLLPRQLTPAEKFTLFRDLQQQWLESLPRSLVSATVRRGDDLLMIAQQLAGSVRQVQDKSFPVGLLAVEGWISNAEGRALGAIAAGTERCLAAHRLAAVMVQLATLARLHALASSQVAIRVQARVEVPTLTVNLHFQPSFWRTSSHRDEEDSGRGMLVRLQDMALGQAHEAGVHKFLAQVLEGLTMTERERLQALAAGAGLLTENLLYELQAQTLAAREDIEATAMAVQRMQTGKLGGRVVSEHTASCCTIRIEIKNGVFPLTRFASFLR